ncbi:DNA polymerase epsilon subunit 3-like [Teleopsis dalmanni]|uniref:DNA polymerase epsilon subunit 3-like n=1 Tax=Teleopsis dalmanni TaxID=139649 RepID=UPI0018CCFFE2|nr:DNA polymerase epsilon subunit 3-like [Teleopsis dalmanni]XP_037934295.1 DNA polymerase epsilon subunit 3-like [Teleopsis dalmanni]XP_037958300.1 DNA polymerase epsilon subunit 3-like [Teleopsis dalmanni]
MVERIEDLNLPNAVVARLIKDALPEGSNVSKEARQAIARAASVFVIYLTSTSTTLAHKQNHKTITAANILYALSQLEFESFVPQLTKDLEAYRKLVKDKKEIKAKKNTSAESDEKLVTDDGNKD